jgi:hypothetical protein
MEFIFIGIVIMIIGLIISSSNRERNSENVNNNKTKKYIELIDKLDNKKSELWKQYNNAESSTAFRKYLSVFIKNKFNLVDNEFITYLIYDIESYGKQFSIFEKESYSKGYYATEETKKYLPVLLKKYNQLVTKDDYGNVTYEKFFSEINYFISNVLHIDAVKQATIWQKLQPKIIEMVFNYMEQKELDAIKNGLIYDEDIDPIEYEHFCKDLLILNGWDAKVTQATADQGVDVIATNNNGLIVAIQCKKYSSPVGNKAVQEIFSAKQHFNADKAVVVTNNTYTKSAKELANTTNVLLLHHNDLENLSNLLKV